MATLVLGTVGRVIGGPIGGLFGAALGGIIDRGIFGNGPSRETGRASNLAIQSATYGEPIPLVFGRMRTAGNLIWSAGIRETATTSGGGKRSGPQTTSYSYSASFAVGLAARTVSRIGRIWADGKLIRDEGGAFLSPIVMRLNPGDADQPVDPLLAAAEAGATPAYRGLAYAVFEDLPLADYGNRIPNLTFEIVADEDTLDAGQVISGLVTAAGLPDVALRGQYPVLIGHHAGRTGSLAEALSPLLAIANAGIVLDPDMAITAGPGTTPMVPVADADAHRPGERRQLERRQQAGPDGRMSALELVYYDAGRDYQPGLQRARRGSFGGMEQRSISSAMAPEQAKQLCDSLLAANHAARVRVTVRLPWRYLWLRPGTDVRLSDGDDVWRIRELRFEAFVLSLDLERLTPRPAALALRSDGGRALAFADVAAGPTALAVLDMPSFTPEPAGLPRLWLAAAGASPAWRRAGISLSLDSGTSFQSLGSIEAGTVMGTALTVLPPGPTSVWDRFGSVDVQLLADAMWLQSLPAASVLAGGNLALIGDEIVHFSKAEALAPNRFRLSGLLRGRRGTESVMAGHASGDRFVLLEADRMLAFDPPLDLLHRQGLARPEGVGDLDTAPSSFTIAGRALQPLAPAHLRLVAVDGDVSARWIRRSRAGYAWIDFVDAPLGEAIEAYHVAVSLDGRLVRQTQVTTSGFTYTAADRLADGDGAVIGITVSQLSALVGAGAPANATLILGAQS